MVSNLFKRLSQQPYSHIKHLKRCISTTSKTVFHIQTHMNTPFTSSKGSTLSPFERVTSLQQITHRWNTEKHHEVISGSACEVRTVSVFDMNAVLSCLSWSPDWETPVLRGQQTLSSLLKPARPWVRLWFWLGGAQRPAGEGGGGGSSHWHWSSCQHHQHLPHSCIVGEGQLGRRGVQQHLWTPPNPPPPNTAHCLSSDLWKGVKKQREERKEG